MSLADEGGGEEFDAKSLGAAESVGEERVSDDDMVFLRGCATQRCAPAAAKCLYLWRVLCMVLSALPTALWCSRADAPPSGMLP